MELHLTLTLQKLKPQSKSKINSSTASASIRKNKNNVLGAADYRRGLGRVLRGVPRGVDDDSVDYWRRPARLVRAVIARVHAGVAGLVAGVGGGQLRGARSGSAGSVESVAPRARA